MSQSSIGSENWWQEKRAQGIPQIALQSNGHCQVTFWWRDPQGDEKHSPIKRVWICITGITDHHQQSAPRSLARLPGTDVWCWQTELSASWRGSYCLIPSADITDFPESLFYADENNIDALRQFWKKLLPCAIADPCNHHCWQNNRGHVVCALHMPHAPAQPGWDKPVDIFPAPDCINWKSQILANTRRVWIFTPGKAQDSERPLAILLDGQFWAQNMPVWSALQTQTRDGILPPALYLLIDVIDNQHRRKELTCNPHFWQAVQQELLPLIRKKICWRDDPSSTIIAGQSFGGLSALYAALYWPARFGCVLSLSGSFWWPNRNDRTQPGLLIKALAGGQLKKADLQIYLEAGRREPIIYRAHQQLLPLLQQSGQKVFFRPIDGGHDALCWRGGLINGLAWLWSGFNEKANS